MHLSRPFRLDRANSIFRIRESVPSRVRSYYANRESAGRRERPNGRARRWDRRSEPSEEKAVISEWHRAMHGLGQTDRDKWRTVRSGKRRGARGIVLRIYILHGRVSNGRADERTEGRMISALLGSAAIGNGKKAHSLDLHFLSLFSRRLLSSRHRGGAFSARLNSPGGIQRRWAPMVAV